MAERMLPQNVSGACSAENSGSVHALFPGISVLGDAVFSGIFVRSGKRTAGSALFIAFADLANGDLRAYLSGQVCGVFVGIAAGGAFGMHWQNLIIGNICDILTHACKR